MNTAHNFMIGIGNNLFFIQILVVIYLVHSVGGWIVARSRLMSVLSVTVVARK